MLTDYLHLPLMRSPDGSVSLPPDDRLGPSSLREAFADELLILYLRAEL